MPGDSPPTRRSCIDIVEALAAAEGVDPLELGYSLYDYVDVEAIDALLANGTADWTIRFEVPDHEVVVRSDRTVLVDGRAYPRRAASPA